MYQLIDTIPVYGNPIDEGALKQFKTCILSDPRTVGGVLCADHHIGYAMPVGGVIAYLDAVSPSGVGPDIGCGNKAVRLDIPGKDIFTDIKTIMDDIYNTIDFGIGLSNKNPNDHPLFDDPTWYHPAMKPNKDKARRQLGTVGSGNHYVDIFLDEQERAWIGVHFGSRGVGFLTAQWFLRMGGASDGMHVSPLVFGIEEALGTEYLECMKLAGKYAYAGRDWVCDKIANMLGAKIVESVHNHHNYAWKENHQGTDLYVVRKGATPAFPGQKGFIGGSMGDNAVIVEGVDSLESRQAFYSTVHGAGRVMSRSTAAGKIDYKTGLRKTEGAITQHMMLDWVKDFDVQLRGAGTDEAPQAYKRLSNVLEAHKETIRIIHTLKPIGVAMAGADIRDPYKD